MSNLLNRLIPPQEIKTENDELIVFDNKLVRTFAGVMSTIFLLIAAYCYERPDILGMFMFIFLLVGIVFGLICLIDNTVTIDKKSQSIVLQTNFPIFESVRKISFSELKDIKVRSYLNGEGEYRMWEVNLIPIWSVYSGTSGSEAKAVAEKIHKITEVNITTVLE